MKTYWTAEMDDLLKSSLEKKLTFSEISIEIHKKFGIELTRNSCIGRASRIGLRSENPFSIGSSKRKREPKKEAPLPAPKLISKKPVVGVLLALREAPIAPLHISIEELGKSHCRYPYGDGPFTFCGHDSVEGQPYCATHFAITARLEEKA